MIGALRGSVAAVCGETVILDVNGVGYEVVVTSSVLEMLPALLSDSAGLAMTGLAKSEVRMVIFTDVRENSISLFGFSEQLEREVFLLLRKVKGIGSRLALNIISSIGVLDVLKAIGSNDIAKLKSVTGIGGKTAERIAVELREYVAALIPSDSSVSSSATTRKSSPSLAGAIEKSRNSAADDVVLALERLGFSTDKAKLAVARTVEGANAAVMNDAGELLRLALGNLA